MVQNVVSRKEDQGYFTVSLGTFLGDLRIGESSIYSGLRCREAFAFLRRCLLGMDQEPIGQNLMILRGPPNTKGIPCKALWTQNTKALICIS